MASRSRFSILWLDSHIGKLNQYSQLKSRFQQDMAPAVPNFSTPPNPIDQMICCVQVHAAPFEFASNVPDMLELIEPRSHDDTKLIIISSGSLGREIIPIIRERGWPIHSYYIFCLNTVGYVEWALDLMDAGLDIQMFDFELDLLIRLARDLSDKIIEQGKAELDDNPKAALSYFECARTLAETAVERDTPSDPTDPHRPSTTHRRILDGEDGLIARAKRACGGH